ncbi:MAG: glycosyltransferase family 39 protein [Acidobacteriota bacterium]
MPEESEASRGRRRPLVLLLALGAILRLVYLLDFRAHSLYWDTMLLDARVYDSWARRIAGGDLWGGAAPYPLPPLYPYLLAGVYRLLGSRYVVVYLLQAVLGLVNVGLVWRLGCVLINRRAGMVAALLTLGYGPILFMETKLLNTTLGLTVFLALLLALLSAAKRHRLRDWLAPGVLLGLLALVRPESLLMAAGILLWMLCRAGRGWAPALVFLLGLGAILAPVAARNVLVAGGEWSPGLLISSQGPVTFYQGNNARAAGLYVSLAREGFSGDPFRQAEESREVAQRRLGRPLTLAGTGRYWLGRALSWILRHPADYLALEAKKMARFFGSCEYSTEYIFRLERENVHSLWLVSLPFGVLAALGLMGWAGRRDRRDPGMSLLMTLLLCNLAGAMLFYVSSRYRMPAAAVLILLAASFLERAWRHDSGRTVIGQAAGVILLALLFQVPIDTRHRAQEASAHANAGSLRYDRGEYAAALDEYRKAAHLEKKFARAYLGQGLALEALGRREEALAAYRRALRLDGRMQAARQGTRRLQAVVRAPAGEVSGEDRSSR